MYPSERENLTRMYSVKRTNRKHATQGSHVGSWNLTGQCKTVITVENTNYTTIRNNGNKSRPISLRWWIAPGGVYWLWPTGT